MAGLFGMSEKREALACVGGPDCVGWKAKTLTELACVDGLACVGGKGSGFLRGRRV